MIPSPQDFNLPINHTFWREHQYETLEWLLGLKQGGVAVVESDVGSGKSAWPAAISSKFKTIVLTATKSLQSQYAFYGFEPIMGRDNYACISPDRLFEDASASDCVFSGEMWKCGVHEVCPYVVQKRKARGAPAAVLNYHYWGLVGRGVEKKTGELNWRKDFLFLDEAHDVARLCVDFFSLELNKKHQGRYFLDEFPQIYGGMPETLMQDRAMAWIERSAEIVGSNVVMLKGKLKRGGKEEKKRTAGRYKAAGRLWQKLENVREALGEKPEDWFIKSDAQGIVVRPLTARHVFPELFLFDRDATTVLMSATIGDFGEFTRELGIERYREKVVPSRFPPSAMPVFVHGDCPPMSYGYVKKHPEAFDIQADLIAKDLKENVPKDWSGLIHVTRRREAEEIRRRLAKRGFGDRVVASPGSVDGVYVPSQDQLVWWNKTREEKPNAILASCSFGTGYDGREERVNYIGKIPFLPWGSEGSYEAAYRKYSHKRYLSMTANLFSQWRGRTRRGRDEDYDEGGEARGRIVVFDGSFNRIRHKLSDGVKSCIVEI